MSEEKQQQDEGAPAPGAHTPAGGPEGVGGGPTLGLTHGQPVLTHSQRRRFAKAAGLVKMKQEAGYMKWNRINARAAAAGRQISAHNREEMERALHQEAVERLVSRGVPEDEAEREVTERREADARREAELAARARRREEKARERRAKGNMR